MLQKGTFGIEDTSKVEQITDQTFFPLTTSSGFFSAALEELTPFFENSMNDSNNCFPNDGKPGESGSGAHSEIFSDDDEDGSESNESFEVRGGLVPLMCQNTTGEQMDARFAKGQGKVKSLKRKLPGPRPAYSDDELTEEEMQRRMRRRERNKMAAARCRQRRVDQTNELLNETKQLETEASRLEKEIESLEKLKSKLEIVLQSHIPLCNANIQDHCSDSATTSSSSSLFLASTSQSSSLVLLSLPAKPQNVPAVGTASVSSNNSSINNINNSGLYPMRPSTLPVTLTSSQVPQSMSLCSDGSMFNFDLPSVCSSSALATPSLLMTPDFSSSSFLTPSILEHQKLFDNTL